MRSIFALTVLVIGISSCRPSRPGSSSLTFGDGDAILKPVLDAVLAGQKTQFSDMSWSGGGGSEDFAVDDSLIVNGASVEEIGARLSTELEKIPDKRGWKSHGFGSGGVGVIKHYEISYEEGDARFFFNFVLVQNDQDVEILILHKGVRR